MEPTTLLTIAKTLQSFVKPFGWAIRKSTLLGFKLRTRWAWIDAGTAEKAAQITLGGNVVKVIPFRNFKSHRFYLAVLHEERLDSFRQRVYLLEKVGGGFLVEWRSDELMDSKKEAFHVSDLIGNGFASISFSSESWGSGSGTRNLYIYSTDTKQLSEIVENHNYSSAGAPDYYPEINAGDDENVRRRVIELAVNRGFLSKIELPDFDIPKFAIHRWHKENGDLLVGKIKTWRYKGEPDYGASINDVAEVGDIRWTAFFKGPLYKFEKQSNEHYIVYSPRNVYDWVTSLIGNENYIFYSSHGFSGLFLYDDKSQIISRYCGYGNQMIPYIDSLEIQDKEFLIKCSGDFVIRVDHVDKLNACKSWCRSSEPHLPIGCREKRFESDELDLYS